jgi:hypothetical protein
MVTRGTDILVTVSEEKAVDSYNDTFECAAILTPEYAHELVVWLQAALAYIAEDQTE